MSFSSISSSPFIIFSNPASISFSFKTSFLSFLPPFLPPFLPFIFFLPFFIFFMAPSKSLSIPLQASSSSFSSSSVSGPPFSSSAITFIFPFMASLAIVFSSSDIPSHFFFISFMSFSSGSSSPFIIFSNPSSISFSLRTNFLSPPFLPPFLPFIFFLPFFIFLLVEWSTLLFLGHSLDLTFHGFLGHGLLVLGHAVPFLLHLFHVLLIGLIFTLHHLLKSLFHLFLLEDKLLVATFLATLLALHLPM